MFFLVTHLNPEAIQEPTKSRLFITKDIPIAQGNYKSFRALCLEQATETNIFFTIISQTPSACHLCVYQIAIVYWQCM